MATTSISLECRQIAKLLESCNRKLVLAESCTAGLVAASLGKIPGISRYFCGSLVTYRNETKAAWLKISPATLLDPGAVSEIVAREMAEKAISVTPEADLAASVTGHLGPHAPQELDGLVFIGLAERTGVEVKSIVTQLHLKSTSRSQRQREATLSVLRLLRQELVSGNFET